MEYKKKLIEVAMPLPAINKESKREKSIRHGHPSTLHLWWSRKPTAAARGVIFASLVDDPSSHPELFPTEEEQIIERNRLFSLMEKLVLWENSNNQEILAEAKAEILKYTDGRMPALLDPFAGGGTIPLEAQRLGLEAHASDLNPVAVMINKAMIEIPPKYAGMPPVNPKARIEMINQGWLGAAGLAEDVRYYGELLEKEAFKKIGYLYPPVKVPSELGGGQVTAIAYLWVRNVKCPNPACGCEMPLTSSFFIAKTEGREIFVEPTVCGSKIAFSIHKGKNAPEGTVKRSGAKCICCGQPVGFQYIREEGKAGRITYRMIAVVGQGNRKRLYIPVSEEQVKTAFSAHYNDPPSGELGYYPGYINPVGYGITHFDTMFTKRQLAALTTFRDLIPEIQKAVVKDALIELKNDEKADEYGKAIALYLALSVDRLANRLSNICIWNATGEKIEQTFGMQGIQMTWNFAEANVFSGSTGSWSSSLEWIPKCLEQLPCGEIGNVYQSDAQNDLGLRNVMVSTDPPYYDSIIYADFSDFFYVWMRGALKSVFPEVFNTVLTPKNEELIANPNRFDGDKKAAQIYFENGMVLALKQTYKYSREDIPVSIYYAYKQKETDANDNTSSKGWEAMLSAIIRSGFSITATWPIRTERPTGHKAFENALASSIVLACRKRPVDAPICTRREFINALKRELKPALQRLQESNIAPVDLAQSAIGPGMGVYSSFSKVLEADGTPMSVRSALQVINQELDLYFTEKDSELDRDSRFCVDLFSQYAFNEMKFGEADVLARAKNTSVERLAGRGVLYAQKGVVRLLTREEMPENVNSSEKIIWQLTQQLTRAMETGGITATAKIVADLFGSNAEHAKALAYRLFTIADRKGWTKEAFAYNSLIIAWRDVQSKAAELTSSNRKEQMDLFGNTDK
jgi:putative DNA methylase